MNTRIIAWACALAAACAPGIAIGASSENPPVIIASGTTPRHAELFAQIRLAIAAQYAAEMRALMTEYDRYEIEMHTQDALKLPPGRSSLRTWKNEHNAQWTHTVSITSIAVESKVNSICKRFREELSVQQNGRTISVPAVRHGTACKQMGKGIVVERDWKIFRPGSVPHDANVPGDTELFIDP